jgi:hypothetical protein
VFCRSLSVILYFVFGQCIAQALVSFKKYMSPPLPYFKVNICSLPLPHFASIFFAYLWSFRRPNYIVTLPRYFSFRLPHLNINTRSPFRRIGQEFSAKVAFSIFQSIFPVCAGFFICIRNSLDRPCVANHDHLLSNVK